MNPKWLTLWWLYVILLRGSLAFDYVGCFKDKRRHALPYNMDRVENIVDCINVCRQNELPYAGLQNGDECHCGTDYDIYGKAINCHRKCRSGEICGGDMANSVYKVGKPLKPTKFYYMGCYKDERMHALSRHMGRSENIEDCINKCKPNHFEYAGLERGEECFCGTNYAKYGKTKICKVKCRSGEICGGEMALSVYKVEAPKSVPECEKMMADVMFLLDDSQHMLESSSMKVKQFVKDIVSAFTIGDDRMRIGSVSFSDWVENNFHLNNHSSVSDVLNAIDIIKRRKRTSFIDSALDYLRTQSFTVANGDRVEAPNVAVIITDGKLGKEDQSLKAAKSIKNSGVIMFVVAVGSSVQMSDFAAFASEPSSEFVYTIDNFDAMDRIKNEITKRICSVHVCDTKPCKNGGECVPKGKAYTCECTDAFQGKDCSQMKPDCSCSVSGDPHYRTFDGQMIHFMGICKYTLATGTNEAPYFFAVEVKNEHRGNTRVSYTRMVDIKLRGVIIRLLPGNKMLVNGERRSLPVNNLLGFSAKFASGWITVSTEWGLQVKFDGKHRANVKVPAIFRNKLTGICGDCNDKKDDLRTKDGNDVSKDRDRFSKVGKSHQVKDDSDKPEVSCNVTDVDIKCKPAQTEKCNLINHPVFHKCRQNLGNEQTEEYVDSCKIDACVYHNDSKLLNKVVCKAIEGFTRECEQAGFPVDWRGVSKCGVTCPPNQVYQFNALVCQPSCSEPQPKCEKHVEACVCKDGYILSGEECVPQSQCGCIRDGVYMKINEEFIDSKCQTKTICSGGGKLINVKLTPCQANSECKVENGQRNCICKEGFELRNGKCKEIPGCTCSVSGDPHYRTFDGQVIHFMGICKYTLATSTKQAPHFFAVEVKNEHRGNTRVSYTRMVDVKLPNVTIRLLPRHKMLVNGEKRSLPINDVLGFSAKFAGGWITVSTKWGLQVKFDGRHRANVKVPAAFANKLSGICGDCNGKKDDLRTKGGKDVSKDRNRFSKIGKSHEVKDDSDKPEVGCDVTDVNTTCTHVQTQGCDVIQDQMFKQCRQELGDERVNEYLNSCKIDACIYHNDSKVLGKVVCQAIEGFARECEEAGFTLNWRALSKCEMTCPPNQVYQFNAFVCQPSCSEPHPKCEKHEEACVCKDGFILSGEECVPQSQCGCMHNGVYMKVNEEFVDSKCQTKTICNSGGKLVNVKLTHCQANSECKVENGQRNCICKEGFEVRNGKCKEKPDCTCSVSGDPHYRTFDGQVIHFMGICKYTLATSTKQAPHFFAVEVKNEHRGNTRVSYTRMVDVKLPNVTIRLLPRHKMLVDGEKRSLPINDVLGFSAKFAGGWITVSTKWGLQVKFDGRHRASVKVPAAFANKLSGICGDCNGKKDDLRTKDGNDVSKDRDRFSKVGKSHEVKDDSDKPEVGCNVTDVNTKCTPDQVRGCDVIQHSIFKQCRQKLGVERVNESLNSCKIDACIYHNDSKVLDKVVCEAIEGFARECEEAGFTLNWRLVSKCELTCPPNQVYQFNAFVCQPSCSEPHPKCAKQEEACVCKDGFILSGEECVPQSQCGCMHNGVYMKVNEEFVDSKCQTKTSCNSGGKLVNVKLTPCQANSECKVENGQRNCICKEGFELRHGKCKEKPDCTCSVSGDPHYRTFDGQVIHFMGICKYTLATSTKQAPHVFAVEVKNEHRGNTRVSYTRMVDVKLPNVTIRLLPRHKMLVDGEKRSLPINDVLGFSAKFAGGWITVSTKWGLQVKFDGRHRASVKVPAAFANKLSGICGDCNGKKDDLRTKEGNDVSKDRDRFSKVGKSHQVKDDSDKPEVGCNVTDVNTKCTPDQVRGCDVIQHSIFKQCRQKLGVERVNESLNSCKIDACIYHNDSKVLDKVVCEAIEGFARECEEAGFTLNWRLLSKCELTCPPNQVYQFNAFVCQPSCSEPHPKCAKQEEACVCKDGFILSGEECVPQSQCGCMHNGVYMKVNEEFVDSKCQTKTSCNSGGKLVNVKLTPCQANSECKVENGQRNCICKEGFELRHGKCKEKPDCTCSVSGDPHYRTFDGQVIHFMGICKYTLATSTKQAPHVFAVEVKNEHRGNTRVSYTRMVDVKLPNVTIRLLPRHKMLVDGEKRSLPINDVLGFSAKFAGGWITVSTKWGLQVKFDGRHRASVKVPAAFANKLSGICGDCNGKKDDLRTKDGNDVSKDRDRFSKVGKSHEVKDDSDKPEVGCNVTDVNTKCTPDQVRGCDVIQHSIFKQCRQKLGVERVNESLNSCKIDACIYHNDSKVLDKVVCEAIEGFARECEEAGFTLNWRLLSKCELTCPPNQVYQFNAFVCQPSCSEPHPKCAKQEEACVCKDGFILSGEECVPQSQCGCMHNGVYMKVNEEFVDSKCQTKTICNSGGKLVNVKLTPCQANSECKVENGQRNCICKDGFELRNGKCKEKPDCTCSVSGDPHYRTFDGQVIHFMGICKYTLATSTKQAPHVFAVEVKNEHRGNTRVSYTRMVDVKLPNVTIRLLPRHKMLVDGEKRSLPINDVLGFSAKFAGGWITVSTKWGLQVKFDGRHRASVKVPAAFANKLSGICGDCNGKKDDLRTKDGNDVSKDRDRFSKVGKSHEVKDDSDKPEVGCNVTDVNTKCTPDQVRGCDVIQHSIFKQCRQKLGVERVNESLNSCKIDACIYHTDSKVLDKVVCEAIEGFARECEEAGFTLNWRLLSKCPMTCPQNQVYQFSALVCQPSCTEPQPKCEERQEACICKSGYILSGEGCVPKNQCGCMHDGVYMKVNEEIIDSKCQRKTICKAGGKIVTENLTPCQANSKCSIANGQRNCICKRGFHLRHGKCKAKPCYSNPCQNRGTCIEVGDAFTCQCKEPFYGNKCSKKRPDCICSVFGDPHYRTFDGQVIHFMGICKYTLATSTRQAPHPFAVEVKNEHRGNTRVSFTRMVDVLLPNVTIRLLPGHKIHVNGVKRSLPINDVLGFSAIFAGRWITVSTKWGLQVQFDGRHRAIVKVPATFASKLTGICGDCNGKKDDLRTKDGKDVSKDRDRFSKVGVSHQVKDNSDKPVKSCDGHFVNTECKSAQTQGCDVIQHQIFNHCRQKLGVERVNEYLESCKIDACIYHNDSKHLDKVVCQAIEGFARECEEAGFTLNWRLLSKCAATCPPNQVYKFNALACQPSCTDPQQTCKNREEACVCKDGYILSGENCVPKSQCGCLRNGTYMKVNEEIIDSNCQTKTICKAGGKIVTENVTPCQANSECSIENGQRTCVCKKGFEFRNGKCKEKPACTCSVSGDPHYRTFDGQVIHFMGICKYTLATSTEQAPHIFAVEVKNEHRGNTRVSYTRMVDVKLPNVTIRLLPSHKILVNGEKRSLPINGFLGISAKFAGGWITVSTKWGLQVQFDGRHRANVKVPATFSNQLSGICGDCNGKKDDLRTKDGKDVSKDRDRFSKVGKSHQVKDDSDKPEFRCDAIDVYPNCTPVQTQKCDVIQHKIFHNCKQKLGDERVREYLDSCKIDACMYRNDSKVFDKVVCEAIEGFARECEQVGFPLDWRKISKCVITCPPTQVYHFNALACQPSCAEPQPKCQERGEACVCKNGYILSGEVCVPKSQCGCLNKSNYMKVNEEILNSNCQSKTICKPGGVLATQTLPPCQKYSTCSIDNGQRTCLCDMGFVLRNGKCTPKVNPCDANPCLNGGKCISEGLTRTCECTGPFDGDNCSRIASDCVCTGSGDPHYKTFDGQWIHFMGTCKYTLATIKATSGNSYFAVQVKNEHRGNTRVAYTRLVDLKLHGVTVRFLQGNKLMVNGELMTLPLTDYLGFSAHFSAGWIILTTDHGIKIQFDGRHRVSVSVPNIYRHQMTGICGDCNGKKDDYKTKEGVNVSGKKNKFSLIGESHRVIDDGDKQEKNCSVVDVEETCGPFETNACNNLRLPTGPFAVCLAKLGSDATGYYKSCVIDSCAYKNKPKLRENILCQAFETLARKCEEIGINADWRSPTKCPMSCTLDKQYSYRISACQPSCFDPYPVCNEGYTEGCVCKPGTILSGTECVPRLYCGCTYKGMYLKYGSSILLNDCSKRITCKRPGVIAVEKGCGENTMCAVHGGNRRCVCRNGSLNGICRKHFVPEPPIVDPELLGPVLHMFIRVSVAYFPRNTSGDMDRNFIGEILTFDAKSCARKCLQVKTCKSFNYDQIKQRCLLLSINAVKQSLVSSDCPYQDYYQLIDSKNIFIRGAAMLSCNHLESIQRIDSWVECQKLCTDKKCKAMEYSSFKRRCTMTKDTRKSYGLTGDELWNYHETLDKIPEMPHDI